ncbi:MAG: thioesterase-like protein [Rhodospirillaceae bacterium]|jgi:acyl-CoA thioester hydrolase|nr:thioesterase-like protein [Rhodospirillaceae bacterium]|tara:strand:- start:2252 stop:2755 length:504 start_codon:yes stop_codon:yes gene_type:complete
MTPYTAVPLEPHQETALPEWVDYNGHMNVAYYVMVFDHGTDKLLDHIGLGKDYREQTGQTLFVVESHVTYEYEVRAGDGLRVTSLILGHDDKRLHVFHHMLRTENDVLAATNELMFVHVDLAARRSATFPQQAVRRIEALTKAQSALPRPPQAGRAIGLKTKGSVVP